MRPGKTVSPVASMTSCDGQGPTAPVAMDSMRPSCTTMVASRRGGAPVPSISVAPRRTVIRGLLRFRDRISRPEYTPFPVSSRVTAPAATRPAPPRASSSAARVAPETPRDDLADLVELDPLADGRERGQRDDRAAHAGRVGIPGRAVVDDQVGL